MTIWQALVLGTVQGLTEFLPVSSSAHLVLVPWALGWTFESRSAFVFDVLVQLGTLMAVFAYFGSDVVRWAVAFLPGRRWSDPERVANRRLIGWAALATVPAVALGLLVKGPVEAAFSNPTGVFADLLVTAGLLLGGEWLLRRRIGRGAGTRPLEQIQAPDALGIGLFQAWALFPGVSRSGATISAAIGRGFDRTSAARFSFLLSIPAMVGAGLVAALDLRGLSGWTDLLPALAVGFAAAALVGYLAIRGLLAFLSRRPLHVFAAYCALVGLGGLLMIAAGG
jgi:undecaprenyl-diphosphatase